MPNILDAYLRRAVILGTLMAMLVLMSVEVLFEFVNEAKAMSGDYQLAQVSLYLFLTMPSRVYQMFPLSALIGTLMSLGAMATRSELIAMRSSGISVVQITRSVLKTSLILIVLTTILGEVIAPMADDKARRNRAFAISGGQAVQTEHGTWLRDGPNYVHIRVIEPGGHLEGITRYMFDDDLHMVQSSYAREANYVNNEWILLDIKSTTFMLNKLKTEALDSLVWATTIQPDMLQIMQTTSLDELSFVGLWKTIKFRRLNNLDTAKYEIVCWQKIMRPMATLVMMFLSVPFIFGPLRSSTMGVKLLIGILLGFSFRTVNEVFNQLSMVSHWPLFIGAIIPSIAFGLLGWLLMRRVV